MDSSVRQAVIPAGKVMGKGEKKNFIMAVRGGDMDAIDAGLEKAWYLDVFDKYGQTAISAASEMVRAAVVLASAAVAAFATVAAFAGAGGGIRWVWWHLLHSLLRVAAPIFFRLPCGCGPDACCCQDTDAVVTRMLMLL